MQTEILQEFIVVAKHSSFRKAADELHISQPALSNHISALERELGFRLFDRNGSAHLTPAGANFYNRAEQMLDLLAKSIQESKEIAAKGEPVRLQMLGQDDSALNRWLTSIKTPFKIVPMSTDQTIFSQIKSGKVDILVTPGMPDLINQDESLRKENFSWLPVGKAKVSYLVSNKNSLAHKDSLAMEDLRNKEILLPFGNLYDWMKNLSPIYYKDLGLSYVQDPSLPVGADRVPLCDLGDRIVVNYRGAAHRSCENRSDLVAIDKLDGKSYEAEEYLVYRADDPNPNVLAFVEEVRTLVGDVQDDANWRANSDSQAGADARLDP